jgi:hypothetical protein
MKNESESPVKVTLLAFNGVKLVWPLAVKVPLTVVVLEVVPIEIALVVAVPILTWPLAVVPVPPTIVTFPPVLVPDPPVALPPWRVNVPPVAVVVPDSSPALRVKAAPVPVAEVLFPGWKTKAVGETPAVVVISRVWPPAKVTTPAVETLKLEPMTWKVPVVLPIVVLFPAPDAKVVVPVDVRFVKVPAAAVVAPIAVELIPVEVVVK